MEPLYKDTFAFEPLAVAGMAVGFTAATCSGSYAAVVRVGGAPVGARPECPDPAAEGGW